MAGAVYPPQAAVILFPRFAPPPPDKDSPRGKAVMNEVEADLQKLFLVAKMRAKSEWYETRALFSVDLFSFCAIFGIFQCQGWKRRMGGGKDGI